MRATASLQVVMYHYVRDLARTPYPRIKAMLLEDFRRQIDVLPRQFEMATLESALAFIAGTYKPARDLCLLTFDDGLKEHAADVTPLLGERGIQGVFFLITGCIEERRVASAHMNHFLMASLDFQTYRLEFLGAVKNRAPELAALSERETDAAQACYPWDSREVASFKYFFNFLLDACLRDEIVRDLFASYIGPEEEFSRELYLGWEDARSMQAAGMVLGGHSHRHRPLSSLSADELRTDLGNCRALLADRLCAQPLWPFCFPFGKHSSFNRAAVNELARLGFACGFTTAPGPNALGAGRFVLRRVDCKNALREPLLTGQAVTRAGASST